MAAGRMRAQSRRSGEHDARGERDVGWCVRVHALRQAIEGADVDLGLDALVWRLTVRRRVAAVKRCVFRPSSG